MDGRFVGSPLPLPRKSKENSLLRKFKISRFDVFSPLAMLHYHTYSTQEEIKSYLETHKDALQCVVGHDYLPFGTAQCPSLSDYADNVDTMMWLNGL